MNAIEIAIKMETDAINFYTEAAEKTRNPVGKKMFLFLSFRHRKLVYVGGA